MFGSDILNVAIGLVFVYLASSLACSLIKEWISGLLDTRAKDLEKRLEDLFQNPKLVQKIYDHPLIKGSTYKSLFDRVLRRKESKPSFIDPKTLAAALADIIGEKGIKEKDLEAALSQLYEGVEKNLEKSVLKPILDTVTVEADKIKKQLELLEKKFATWFDASMVKMSAWYKQKSRFVIFIIAILLSGALNIDSIMISKVLYQDEAVREKIVAAAGKVQNPKDNQDDSQKNALQRARELEAKLSDLGLPIGWNFDVTWDKDLRGRPTDWGWLLKAIGILISAFAISMGAPFWFDILRKLMSFRKGNIPAKQEEE